jgi:hypothetical protein
VTEKRKTWTVTCRWGCGHTWEAKAKPPADGIGCGTNPECLAKHNAAVAAANELRRQRAAQRRREVRANPPVPVYGEWGYAMLLANPGLGSVKARRLAATTDDEEN